MSKRLGTLVASLQDDGFGYIPINAELVSYANDSARLFIESLEHRHHEWQFTRPGEDKPDVGVVDKMDKDIRTIFHLSHDMPVLACQKKHTSQQRECLRVMDTCRRYLEELGVEIATELEDWFSAVKLRSLVELSARIAQPYNVPTLRFLSYPDASEQKGTSPHYDRSFLTMHLGGSGGNLLIQNKQGDWVRASPPLGSALVFFGVKVLELSGGAFKPCYHKSVAIRGRERTATVMFIHADIGRPVIDPQVEYDTFFSN